MKVCDRNYTYDNAGQLKTALGYEADTTPRFNEQLGYTYDPAGNLNFRTNHAFVQTFNNNSLNELTTVTRTGTLTVSGNTTAPATDVTVNGLIADRYADLTYARTNFPLVNGTTNFTAIAASSTGLWDTNTVTVDLLATHTFVYDLNGNLISDGKRGLDYDDENQMIRVIATNAFKKEFTYDGVNRLRARREFAWSGSAWVQTNETRFIYDGVLPIQHRDANDIPTLTLTRGLDLSGSFQGAGGIGGLLAMTESSGMSSYYHADGNGNVTTLVNGSQLIVARRSYEPFGATLSLNGPKAGVNPYWFSSELWDEDTRFSHYPRRVYIPALQRFANRDPIAEEGGINLYRFVVNNPVNAVDPFGLWNLWNPATWGDANPNGWSAWNSLTPWHESSGYTWEGIKWNTGQAAQATLDGIIPFWDPFKDNEGYDPCDGALAWSRRLGAISRDAYAGRVFSGLFSAGGNSMFFSGRGAAQVGAEVFPSSIPLSATLGGRAVAVVEPALMNALTRVGFSSQTSANIIYQTLWRGASAVYAANAQGVVPVVISGAPAAGKIVWMEIAIMNTLRNATPVLVYLP